MPDSILHTGGAGFIGSLIAVELARAGGGPVVQNNFCNSKASVIERLGRIIGPSVDFMQGDIRDGDLMRNVLRDHGITGVIHLAGLMAVGESISMPRAYYDNNVVVTLALLKAMNDCGVRSIEFSSSATVYGEPQRLPLTKSHPLSATSSFGLTKLTIELMLRTWPRATTAGTSACFASSIRSVPTEGPDRRVFQTAFPTI
jgi:UDP-glucose 4-epimerase